jgi:hypothetical protein
MAKIPQRGGKGLPPGGIAEQALAAGTVPTFAVKRVSRSLTFRCPKCRERRWHGAHSTLCAPECPCQLHDPARRRGADCTCPVGAGNGHRVSHCGKGCWPGGSYLREVAP